MTKPTNGRAGRENRRADQRDTYGQDLAGLLLKQLGNQPRPNGQVLTLGNPGVATLINGLAPRLTEGAMTSLTYTFDEFQDTQAVAANYPNVQVLNELEEITPGARFDLVICIAPYYLSLDYITELIERGLGLLKKTGLFVLAGDRRHDFERYLAALSALASPVDSLANNAHLRIVQVEARAIRRRGGLVRRLS